MVMSKLFHKIMALLLTAVFTYTDTLSAQMLPILGNFSNRTFQGVVDVSWPVCFEDCSFVTDSVVLQHSYGALFRNCSFESRTGKLYLAESGDGMILADCKITGCAEPSFSRKPSLADRNYFTGVTVNGEECSSLDEQESIIEICGLELEKAVKGISQGPLFMLASADGKTVMGGNTITVQVRGLDDGMFVGWMSSDSTVKLDVDRDFICKVTVPGNIKENRTVVISAYTEYGLEASCELNIVPDIISYPEKVNYDRKSRRKKR